jgi:hypothetical protein
MKKAEILTLLRDAREQMDRSTEYFAGYRDLVARLDAGITALTPPQAPPIVWTEHVTQERGPLKSLITRRSWEGTDGEWYATVRPVEGGIFWLVGEEAPYHFATLEEAKAVGEERIRKYAQQIRCPECWLLFDGDDE